jgi:HEPN domain-containing protein
MTSRPQTGSWQLRKAALSIRFVFIASRPLEKYLKCLLTFLGIQTPRTHDLKALISLVPAGEGFSPPVEHLVELNPYAVGVRYVDDWREPQLSDARRALALASEVRAPF